MAEDKDGTYWDGSSMTRAVSKIAGIPGLRAPHTIARLALKSTQWLIQHSAPQLPLRRTRRSTRSVNTQPASDKENRNNSDGEHGKPQKSHHSRRVESEDEDDSHREEDDYQPEQADSDNDNDSEAADADKDSEAESDRGKCALLFFPLSMVLTECHDLAKVQAEAEKNAKAEKAAKAAKKKAGVVVEDARPPIDDDHFAARFRPRPSFGKTTAQVVVKNMSPSTLHGVAPSALAAVAPQFGAANVPRALATAPRARALTTAALQSLVNARPALSTIHTRSRTRSPRRAPSPRRGSSPPVRHTFRGRSPAHESPARRPVLRDINNNVVTNPIAVNLRSDHHRARSSSPHRSSSPGSAAVHRLSTQTMTCVPLLSHGPAAQVADPVPRISMMTARNMSPLPATKYYRCLLARRQAFPDSRMETEMVREA
ncbi:hypothetical protein R3P38DRAFT_3270511 [Favolaschia claudopus]|uniref:Uncharacterized protein n=1 Tax=Favolaschia claudopus TaxID=2862362 RepID=A0AAW0BB37_9AGAR